MAIETLSQLQAEALQAARSASASGVAQTRFGSEVQGWTLVEGTSYPHKQGKKWQDGTDWKDMCTVDGIIVLSPDGTIHEVWHAYGTTEEIGSFDNWGAKPASKEKLVGQSGEPFAKVAAGLRRLKALAS